MNMKKMFSALIFLLTMLLLINGLIPQLEMAIFGSIVIPTVITKVFMSLILLLSLFFSINLKDKLRIVMIWWIFITYLLIDAIRFLTLGKSVSDVLTGYNMYYFTIILLPLYFLVEKSIAKRKIEFWLLFSVIPLAILGICQYIQKDPILPTESPDQSFKVMSFLYIVDNNIRAFSLFNSGLAFGHFLCLCVSIVFSSLLLRKNNIVLSIGLIFLITAAIYMTITRVVYIEFVCVLMANLIISKTKNKKSKLIEYLPIIYCFVGYFISNIAPIITSKLSNNLVDSTTLLTRQELWLIAKDKWFSDLGTFLFGSGLYQSGNAADEITIDNSFVALGTHIGVVGLILWIIIMWRIWKYCLKVLNHTNHFLDVGLVSFFSTFMITGMFNINIQIYTLSFLLMLLSKEVIKLNTSSKRLFDLKI